MAEAKMVKMEKIVKRRLSINIKVENVDADQKKRIVLSFKVGLGWVRI